MVGYFSTSRFQSISYIPRSHLLAPDAGNGTDQNRPGGEGIGETYPEWKPGEAYIPAELYTPVPAGLSREEKLSFIKNKYLNVFAGLEAAYRQELHRLALSAWNDYQAIQSGRLDMSLPALARQYIGAARSLEKEADRDFAGILGEMKTELKTADLPTDLAKEAEREYKRQKNETRREMLKQVASLIK